MTINKLTVFTDGQFAISYEKITSLLMILYLIKQKANRTNALSQIVGSKNLFYCFK